MIFKKVEGGWHCIDYIYDIGEEKRIGDIFLSDEIRRGEEKYYHFFPLHPFFTCKQLMMIAKKISDLNKSL